MSLDTLLAVLSSALSILSARVILDYFSTVLLKNRNILTRLHSLLIGVTAAVVAVTVNTHKAAILEYRNIGIN